MAQGYLGTAGTQPATKPPASSTGIPAALPKDNFLNLAKKGYEVYSESQNVNKTGGQELNSPHNSGTNSGGPNEQDVTRAHEKAYKEGNLSGLNASSLGSAAAMQVLQQFTSGGKGSGGSSGGSSTDLISLAMAEATKLFDKSGGTASGNKQDAVNGAAMTVMKLLVQSKFSGGAATTGGSNSGGLGGLLSLELEDTKNGIHRKTEDMK
uniref:Beta-flanking protein n=1 Tax=Collybia nuda TaxID=64659 RepID=A0A0K0MNM2_9AGAR|nr:beta-flanking protein [Collybia nuda]